MKNTIPVIIISFFMLGLPGCATTKSTEKNTGENARESIGGTIEQNIEKSAGDGETQPGYSAGAENMGNIKVIGPPMPMVAPSTNEQAMRAYTMGSRFLNENNLSEAERYLKEAVELDPLFVDAMDHLGMVYRRQNRLDEAEEMYLRSISINDKNVVPYQNLAVVYKLKNRLNDALELYRKMAAIDENDPEPYYGIGGILYTVRDYERALLFFDKAIELYIARDSAVVYDAYYYKGIIYYEMNNYDEALKYLEAVQKADPNNQRVNELIVEIKNKKI